MAIIRVLILALVMFSVDANASTKVVDIDFEDTGFSEYFFERWYSRFDQTEFDELGSVMTRSTDSYSGTYSASVDLDPGSQGNIGYGSDAFGNTDGVDFTDEFDSMEMYYSFWMKFPASYTWAGQTKIIYQGYSNLDCQWVLSLSYAGGDGFFFELHNNTPPDGYATNWHQYGVDVDGIDIGDGDWHHIELYFDWSMQTNGATFTCDGLDCTATANGGTMTVWIDDSVAFDSDTMVFVRDGVGTRSPALRTSVPANHSGDALSGAVNVLFDDIEIWDGMPSETAYGSTIQCNWQ